MIRPNRICVSEDAHWGAWRDLLENDELHQFFLRIGLDKGRIEVEAYVVQAPAGNRQEGRAVGVELFLGGRALL